MRKLFFTIWQCLLLCSSAAAVNLMDAVGSDNVKAIADSLARPDGKADLNKIGRGGQTPLMHAGEFGVTYIRNPCIVGYILQEYRPVCSVVYLAVCTCVGVTVCC